MPRNMSFAMTPNQITKQTKTVTRRYGWWFLKPGDIVQPVEKAMGLRKGEKICKIGPPVKIISARAVRLCDIDKDDCIKEGFPEFDPDDFVDMIQKHYGRDPTEKINRIEFEYLEHHQ